MYRKDSLLFIINSNNGLECQNRAFKYQDLNCSTKLLLTKMVSSLVETYLPEKLKKCKDSNIDSTNSYMQGEKVIVTKTENFELASNKHLEELATVVFEKTN